LHFREERFASEQFANAHSVDPDGWTFAAASNFAKAFGKRRKLLSANEATDDEVGQSQEKDTGIEKRINEPHLF